MLLHRCGSLTTAHETSYNLIAVRRPHEALLSCCRAIPYDLQNYTCHEPCWAGQVQARLDLTYLQHLSLGAKSLHVFCISSFFCVCLNILENPTFFFFSPWQRIFTVFFLYVQQPNENLLIISG